LDPELNFSLLTFTLVFLPSDDYERVQNRFAGMA